MLIISIIAIIYFCVGAIWASVMLSEYWEKYSLRWGRAWHTLLSIFVLNLLTWPLSIVAYYTWWK